MTNPQAPLSVDALDLDRFVRQVLDKSGLSPESSRITATVLLDADRRNIPSHGVARLPRYTRHLKDGTIRAGAGPFAVRRLLRMSAGRRAPPAF